MVLLYALTEHIGIYRGVQRQEGRAKAGGEGGLRLNYAALGTGKLGGVAGYEVVHSLVGIELGDRRQHAESISRKEYNGLGMAGDAWNQAVGYIIHGIADAGILGKGTIGIVKLPGIGVHYNVLNKGAELDGVPDLGLILLGKVDALRVAAALYVEYAILAPAVLIVAYKAPVRIGGKGGLAGSGKAEEQRAVAIVANVGRAMHGEHALLGQQVVHHGEYALFYLTGVLAAGDYYGVLFEVYNYSGFAVYAVYLGRAFEAGGGYYGEAGHEVLKLLLGRTDEQLMNEQVLAGKLVYNAHGQMIAFVCAGKAFEYEKLAALQIRGHAVIYGFIFLFAYGYIDLAPVDIVMDIGSVDNKTIVRRTAGILAGGNDKRAGLAKRTFAAAEGMLDKLRRSKVPVHGLGRYYAKRLDVITHFQKAPFNAYG